MIKSLEKEEIGETHPNIIKLACDKAMTIIYKCGKTEIKPSTIKNEAGCRLFVLFLITVLKRNNESNAAWEKWERKKSH